MKNRSYLLLVSIIMGGLLANEQWAQPSAGQTVTCELFVETYGAFGRCVMKEENANLPLGPRTGLARYLWTGGAARVVMTNKPSDASPWKGVLIVGDRNVAFEIERDPKQKDRLMMLNSWSWVRVYDYRETRPPSGSSL